MSFMYNPIPYDDVEAINKVHIPSGLRVTGFENVKGVIQNLTATCSCIAIDGYIGADFSRIEKQFPGYEVISTTQLMKDEQQIKEMIKEFLPIDSLKDPNHIFGKLYEGNLKDIFDDQKIKDFLERVSQTKNCILLVGHGSAMECFQECIDQVFYIDLTPKDAVLRSQQGLYRNLGTSKTIPFKDMIRRYYYIDVELLMKHRKHLIQNHNIDFYVLETWKDEWHIFDQKIFTHILEEVVKQPFRCKPVYLEGIWGGEFIRKLRHIPKDIAPRIAWVFEFIPLEASILLEVEEELYDFPFYTLLNLMENEILGDDVQKRFHGNFPIRFNYDDTWHSDGNMSVQVHPNKQYAMENYNENHSQDEAYYVVTCGHGAKTYCGFKKDGSSFIKQCEDAQKSKKEIAYEDVINGIPSHVGMQVMIPSGTVHASGRNQVVLELGSYTVGAYTYKMYDYNRQDLDGNLRPIHLYNADKVLQTNRDSNWVHEHANIDPILIRDEQQCQEWIVGRNSYMYYETHQIQMATHAIYRDTNHGQFTVLTLVDGEEALIYDADHPERQYHAKYLDVVVLPNRIKDYVVEAKGYQPITLHKTMMKQEENTHE